MFFKASAEVKGVWKPAFFRHRRNGQFCLQEQIPGNFQSQPDNILAGCCACYLAEGLQEQGFLDMGLFQQILQCQRAAGIFMNI